MGSGISCKFRDQENNKAAGSSVFENSDFLLHFGTFCLAAKSHGTGFAHIVTFTGWQAAMWTVTTSEAEGPCRTGLRTDATDHYEQYDDEGPCVFIAQTLGCQCLYQCLVTLLGCVT